jgi:membrane protein
MAVEPVDQPGPPDTGRSEVVEVGKRLLARTVSSCFRYRVTGLAAEAAFFAILSLPPLVFGLAGTIGYIARQFQVAQVDVLKNRVIDLASQALTPDAVQKVITPTMNDVLKGGRIDVISIGFVLALWSGSRALNVFIDTISIMYGLGGYRGIVKTRALSFTMYVVALLIGIVLVPLVLAGPDVVADIIPDRAAFLRQLYWPSVLVLSVGFMTTLYHLSVPAKKTWRSGVPGAAFTLTMWILGSFFVRWALGYSADGTSIYGPLAAPIAVLLWLYVLSISVLIGAAINAAIDVERHPRDEESELGPDERDEEGDEDPDGDQHGGADDGEHPGAVTWGSAGVADDLPEREEGGVERDPGPPPGDRRGLDDAPEPGETEHGEPAEDDQPPPVVGKAAL